MISTKKINHILETVIMFRLCCYVGTWRSFEDRTWENTGLVIRPGGGEPARILRPATEQKDREEYYR